MSTDALLLTGLALVVAGLAFKASVAPFHQWTPDVYEGAPTPITAFMAVATKAAAFGVILRFFDVALIGASDTWAPALATLAVVTIVVGNVGAIGQSSLKRLLAYSSVAQAGYMLAGVVVTTQLGVQAVVFYLAVYLLMNLAAFAVIVARERETGLGDDISTLYGLGADRPLLAWPMTIAMLSLAGFPATAGFFGKVYLIERGGRQRLRLARRGDRARLGDLARVLPAGRRGGVDAGAGRADARARSRRAPPRPAIAGGSRGGRRGPRGGRGERAARGRERETASAAGRSRRSSGSPWCAPRRRCSSGCTRARCSTSPRTRARRLPTCSELRRAAPARAVALRRGRATCGGRSSSRAAPTPSCARSHRRPGVAEYVALLLVIAAVLAGAATAAVARRPASATRSRAPSGPGICIVGGDVCRPPTPRRPDLRRA